MEHPFIDRAALQEKTLEELQEGISSLMGKLSYAYRSGNAPLASQLQMVLETYRNQHSKKMDEVFEKQKLGNRIKIQSDNAHKN